MKVLKRSERQLIVEQELFVTEELEKEISDDMFYAYGLLYQRDRYFYLQSKDKSKARTEKTTYYPLE